MRKFVKITIDELQKKIDEALEKVGNIYAAYTKITPTVEKDLSKVHFDCENFDCVSGFGYDNKVMGYHTLDNGFTFLGCAAGGDWECPVWFCIYFDGKKLRGYIPKDGNVWNYKAKWALGNCNWDDCSYGEHNYPDQKFAMDVGLFDDDEDWSQFSVKEREQYYIEREADDIGNRLRDVDKIIKDIQERIIEK